MSNEADREDQQSSARGDAAWKETMERVAGRNEQARKAGKERRATYERERENARRVAEGRRHAKLVGRRSTR
jgi:hypothetical protein